MISLFYTGWRPGFHDPDALGWTTTALYILSFSLCLACALNDRSRRPESRNSIHKRFWFCLATVMLALGINKELDFQTWLLGTARNLSRKEGWYAWRQAIKIGFAVGVILSGALFALWNYHTSRKMSVPAVIALAGICVLCTFVFLRVVPFSAIGVPRATRHAFSWTKWFFELGGIALVLLACILDMIRPRSPRESRKNP